MGILSSEKQGSGHIRLFASGDGELNGIEVVSSLVAEEVQPALEQALRALAPKSEAARHARIDAHKKAVSKKAGMLDKIRGKASQRLEAAERNLPTELFEGSAGSVTIYVDGMLGFVKLDVVAAIGVEEAAGLVPRALDNAQSAALAAWEHAVLADEEDDKES
jgi:DNA-binding protein YbaB